VEGDAADGSQDNIKMVQQRGADEAARRWGFVCAMARTWKTVEEKAIKDLVTHSWVVTQFHAILQQKRKWPVLTDF